MNLRNANSKALLYKVRPVKDHIPPPDADWTLPPDHPFYSSTNKDRRVLLVQHIFERRNGEKTSQVDEAKGDFFYVDVPEHFFAKVTEENKVRGDFIATPPYDENDILVVQWTGYGRYSGWIDTNVQMRGVGISAGGGGQGGGVACAKWS